MTYQGDIEKLAPDQIFVFGSNTQGRHGRGAALVAKQKFGAIYGQAEGRQGQSYAIITKDLTKDLHPSRTPEQIVQQIKKLYDYANSHPQNEFWVAYTRGAKNLNAYTDEEMAAMFATMDIPGNIVFEEGFAELISQFNINFKYEK